ncbi:DUF1700 domain-containing protein [Kurthia sibirica]|uniref:DUF1700 domain-containing protein n=1 Tax=Kurthia sibirica TaxID=202750 RepID=UPI00116D8A42|nr:DUF1700 domain-containing protein [Kurthia sibirica]GEK33403.1 hypothetical protein KSI01_09360 [Kurthia sibirica]
MNKLEYLSELGAKLRTLPRSELNKVLSYYSEIIDDRMEDGMSEVHAVCGLGDIDEIAQEAILEATPFSNLIIPSRSLSTVDILLLVMSTPLIIALFTLILVFYAGIWLSIIGLFLLDLSFILVGITGIIASIVDFSENSAIQILMFIVSLIAIGIGIFAYSPIKVLSQKIVGLTTWFMRKIKLRLFRKRV